MSLYKEAYTTQTGDTMKSMSVSLRTTAQGNPSTSMEAIDSMLDFKKACAEMCID
jgi:hypothetical protein